MKEEELHQYCVATRCTCTKHILVVNCKSAAEAKRKAQAMHPDAEGLDFTVDRVLWSTTTATRAEK